MLISIEKALKNRHISEKNFVECKQNARKIPMPKSKGQKRANPEHLIPARIVDLYDSTELNDYLNEIII